MSSDLVNECCVCKQVVKQYYSMYGKLFCSQDCINMYNRYAQMQQEQKTFRFVNGKYRK